MCIFAYMYTYVLLCVKVYVLVHMQQLPGNHDNSKGMVVECRHNAEAM